MSQPVSIPLATARHCLDCDRITDAETLCPACGSGSLYPVADWINRKPMQGEVLADVPSER